MLKNGYGRRKRTVGDGGNETQNKADSKVDISVLLCAIHEACGWEMDKRRAVEVVNHERRGMQAERRGTETGVE